MKGGGQTDYEVYVEGKTNELCIFVQVAATKLRWLEAAGADDIYGRVLSRLS